MVFECSAGPVDPCCIGRPLGIIFVLCCKWEGFSSLAPQSPLLIQYGNFIALIKKQYPLVSVVCPFYSIERHHARVAWVTCHPFISFGCHCIYFFVSFNNCVKLFLFPGCILAHKAFQREARDVFSQVSHCSAIKAVIVWLT